MTCSKETFNKVNNLRIKINNAYARLRELSLVHHLRPKIQANIVTWTNEHNAILKANN